MAESVPPFALRRALSPRRKLASSSKRFFGKFTSTPTQTTQRLEDWYATVDSWGLTSDVMGLAQYYAEKTQAQIDTLVKAKAWEFYMQNPYADADTEECKAVVSELDDLKGTYNLLEQELTDLSTNMGHALDFCDQINWVHPKLKAASDGLGMLELMANVLSKAGPLATAGKIAKAALGMVADSVKGIESKVRNLDDNYVTGGRKYRDKLDKLKTRLDDDVLLNLELAEYSFDYYLYKRLIIADHQCPAMTRTSVCTNQLKQTLKEANDALKAIPVFEIPAVNMLKDVTKFVKANVGTIKLLTFSGILTFMQPIYDWLNKQ